MTTSLGVTMGNVLVIVRDVTILMTVWMGVMNMDVVCDENCMFLCKLYVHTIMLLRICGRHGVVQASLLPTCI